MFSLHVSGCHMGSVSGIIGLAQAALSQNVTHGQVAVGGLCACMLCVYDVSTKTFESCVSRGTGYTEAGWVHVCIGMCV